jgi:hypothetical protein
MSEKSINLCGILLVYIIFAVFAYAAWRAWEMISTGMPTTFFP